MRHTDAVSLYTKNDVINAHPDLTVREPRESARGGGRPFAPKGACAKLVQRVAHDLSTRFAAGDGGGIYHIRFEQMGVDWGISGVVINCSICVIRGI